MQKQSFTTWFLSGAITLPKLVVLLVTIGTATTMPLLHYLFQIDKDSLPTYFAGFQVLVCLVLFALVPRPVPPEHGLLLRESDILAPMNMVAKLNTEERPYKLLLTQLKNTRWRIEKCTDRVEPRLLRDLVDI